MSTLEIACGNCEKKFRVRSEFAGRTTRCPGCSSPITVGGPSSPVAPRRSRADDDERPPPRQRLRDEDDDEPRRKTLDWRPVDAAFSREQWALVFVFFSILGAIFSACLGAMSGLRQNMDGFVPLIVAMIGVGPVLVAAAFALMARIAALGVPRESYAKGSAVASMLCGLAAAVCIVVFGFSWLMGIESGIRSELPTWVSVGGLVLTGIASIFTFIGFTAQVGIARKSAEVSRAIARMGITTAICTLIIIAISVVYVVYSQAEGSQQRGNGFGRRYYEDHSLYYRFVLVVLIPISFGVILILYHRMLGAARKSLSLESSRKFND